MKPVSRLDLIRLCPRLAVGSRRGALMLMLMLIVVLAYGIWPYATLMRLNRALVEDNRSVMSALIDLRAVRAEIARALDKSQSSAIDRVSDPFIAWLEPGLRRYGAGVLDELITLEWIRERLLTPSNPEKGFIAATSYAFFEGPGVFKVRLDRTDAAPLVFRLGLVGAAWRMTMVDP